MQACPSPRLTSVYAEADRAELCKHHHAHQKLGEGGLMSGEKGLICP